MFTDTEKKDKKTRCPKCKKEIAIKNNPFKPFCSDRCKMIDLGAWFSEQYKVTGEKDLDETEME